VLSQSRVFAALPRSELGVLAEMLRVESFAKDNTVMEAGEAADNEHRQRRNLGDIFP